MTALDRALSALAVIDEYAQLPTNRQGGVAERNHHAALERLGDAMGEIYGPLPALRVRGWDDDDGDEIPRDAKCGTEDGYRWHLAHDATPCRPCRLAFDEVDE